VGKAAVDRLAKDMAHELRAQDTQVAALSLWPGGCGGVNDYDYDMI
jgi:hypothetical protein